jgi:hypothetical protein
VIFTPWALVFGGALVAVTMIVWFWPRRHEKHPRFEQQPHPERA